MSDSDDGLENWQNRLNELHDHRCARITKSLRCLSAETRTLPTYEGLTDPGELIVQFAEQALELQRIQAPGVALRATIAIWWNGHKKYIHSWEDCQKSLHLSFTDQPQEVRRKFNVQNSSQEHFKRCYAAWEHVPCQEWVHRFVHTLEPVAKKWYMEVKIQHDTAVRLIHNKELDDQDRDEYQTDAQNQGDSVPNLTSLLQVLLGCAKGQYCAKDVYCDEAKIVMLQKHKNMTKPKTRPLKTG